MKIVTMSKDFNAIESSINCIIDKSKKLPENVFRGGLKYFLFITFDELFMTLFYNHLKQYLVSINEASFWLTVMDPDPASYFAMNFDFFGAFEISSVDDEYEYIAALNDYPADSPADAIMHNSNSLVISSYTNKWAVFGSRKADIAICAFSDHKHMELFKLSYGSDLLDGIKAAAEYAFDGSDTSQKEEFHKNYKALVATQNSQES